MWSRAIADNLSLASGRTLNAAGAGLTVHSSKPNLHTSIEVYQPSVSPGNVKEMLAALQRGPEKRLCSRVEDGGGALDVPLASSVVFRDAVFLHFCSSANATAFVSFAAHVPMLPLSSCQAISRVQFRPGRHQDDTQTSRGCFPACFAQNVVLDDGLLNLGQRGSHASFLSLRVRVAPSGWPDGR